jgi:hypothetical protein
MGEKVVRYRNIDNSKFDKSKKEFKIIEKKV